MFVGTSRCLRHEHSVLPQGRGLLLALTERFLVFDIAFSRLSGRAPPARDSDNFERVRQSLANQVYLVAALYASAWRGSLAVDSHMASDHRCGRAATCLEETTAEQPPIDAQGIGGRSFSAFGAQG